MNNDPAIRIGRLAVYITCADVHSWGLSTFADSVIRSLRLRIGQMRISFTLDIRPADVRRRPALKRKVS